MKFVIAALVGLWWRSWALRLPQIRSRGHLTTERDEIPRNLVAP